MCTHGLYSACTVLEGRLVHLSYMHVQYLKEGWYTLATCVLFFHRVVMASSMVTSD